MQEQIIFQGIDKTGAATKSAKSNVESLNNSTKKLGNSFSTLQKTLVGVGAALATGAFARSVIATSARFEDLRTSLSSVTGSAEEGAKAFGFVSKFATRTQFSVEDLSKTFIKLKASGLEPTEKLLTTFTDTAAITTDQVGTLEAITDLFARTVSGGLGLEELNRLADRGVPVFRILEEQLGLTRLQISEFGKTAEGAAKITEALSKGIQEDFGGATQNVLDNLSTKMSNFAIASNQAKDAIGRGGLSDALGDVIVQMTDAIVANEELFLSIGEALGDAIRATASAFEFLIDNIKVLKALGMAAIAFAAAKAFQSLVVAIRSATLATVNFNKAFRKNIVGILVAGAVAAAEFFGLFDKFFAEDTTMDNLTRKLDRISRGFGDLEHAGDGAFSTIQDEASWVIKDIEKQNEKIRTQIGLLEEIARGERGRDPEAYQETLKSIEDLNDKLYQGEQAIQNYWDSLLSVPFEEIIINDINQGLVEQISLFDQLARKSLEDYKKALSKLSDEKLFEKALTPTQKEKQALEQRLADIEEFKKRGLISEEEYQRRRQEIIFDSDQKIIDLARARRIKELQIQGMTRENAEQLAEFEKKTQIEKAQFILASATESFAELGKVNRQAFLAYKAFAISQAIIDTYTSAQKAYFALAGIPFVGPALGVAAAAAAVAAGMARVNAIRSQSYSGRQQGGPVGAGQTYLVGEAGPELFQAPAGGGSIIPNSQMGGGGVTVNFTVHAIDAQSFQGALAEQEDTIVNIINQAVTNTGKEPIVA